MRERDIQGKVVHYARSKGVVARKLDFGEGWPDYMFLYSGRIIFIEFKGANGRLRPLQSHMHSILRRAGFEVMVIDSVAEGEAEIDEFIEIPMGVTRVVDYSDIIKKTVENRK